MAPENVKRLWVVEYSCLQQSFHLETVDKMLHTNFNVTAGNKVPGYIPLLITPKREEADTYIKNLRPLVENRPLPVNSLKPIEPDDTAAIAAGMSNLSFDELMRRINGA